LMTPRRVLWLAIGAICVTLAYRYGMFLHAADRSVGEKVLLLEQMPGRLDQFALGSVAAVWVANRSDMGRSLAPWLARALIVFALSVIAILFYLMGRNYLMYWEGHPLLFSFHLGISVAIVALIIALCSDRERDLRLLRTRPMIFLGTISYSLYLWHQLILQWLAKQPWLDTWSPYPLPGLLLIGGGLAIAVAWISWRLVEKPCLAWAGSSYTAPK